MDDKNYQYSIEFQLYNLDGTRSTEVRIRLDGQAYFVELEHVEGTTWKPREPREDIGPFKTVEEAEIAAVNRPWFLKRDH